MTFLETAELFAAGGIALWLYSSYHRMKFKRELKEWFDEQDERVRKQLDRFTIENETMLRVWRERVTQSVGDRIKRFEQRNHDEHNTLAQGISDAVMAAGQIGKLLCLKSKNDAAMYHFQTNAIQNLIRALFPIFTDIYDEFMENDDFEKATAYSEILKQMESLANIEAQTQTISLNDEEKDVREEGQNQ